MEWATLYRVHIRSDLTYPPPPSRLGALILFFWSQPRGCVHCPPRLRREDAPVVSHRPGIHGPGPARLRVSRPFPQTIRHVAWSGTPCIAPSICNASHACKQSNPHRTLLAPTPPPSPFGSYLSLSRIHDDIMAKDCVLCGAFDQRENYCDRRVFRFGVSIASTIWSLISVPGFQRFSIPAAPDHKPRFVSSGTKNPPDDPLVRVVVVQPLTYATLLAR
ncbi:hypothetical protein H4582DRAFT_80581 [Lactarius indigo]|nr:hypothetical protein H4582DRAFT_80581 [Lactarius indigo]